MFSYGNVDESAKKYWELINRRFKDFISDKNRPPLKPEILYNKPSEILKNHEILPTEKKRKNFKSNF